MTTALKKPFDFCYKPLSPRRIGDETDDGKDQNTKNRIFAIPARARGMPAKRTRQRSAR
jgi:hypothetical protein